MPAAAAQVIIKHLTVNGPGTPWWESLVLVLAGGAATGIVTWFLAPRLGRRQRQAERRDEALKDINKMADLRALDLVSRLYAYSGHLPAAVPSDQESITALTNRLDRIDKASRELFELLIPTSASIVQAADRELAHAFNRLFVGTMDYRQVAYEFDIEDRLDRALGAAEWLDRMQEARSVLANRSLQLLNAPTGHARRLFRQALTAIWVDLGETPLPKPGRDVRPAATAAATQPASGPDDLEPA